MDPTTTELQTFAGPNDVLAWVGMDDPVWQGLCGAMGTFTMVREVVLVPQDAWDAGVRAASVQRPAPNGTVGPLPAARPLAAIELGQAASIRRVCRLRLGLPADEGGAVGPFGAVGSFSGVSGSGAPPGKGPASVTVRKVKMSAIFDQGDDTEILPWTPARMRTVRQRAGECH